MTDFTTKVTLTDEEIWNCARDIIKMEATCIEWGATAQRSIELVDIRIRELLKIPQRFSSKQEGVEL